MGIVASLVLIVFFGVMIWEWSRPHYFPKNITCPSCKKVYPLETNHYVSYGQPASVGDDGETHWGKCPFCGESKYL